MLDSINQVLVAIDDFVWGIPLIVLILLTGIIKSMQEPIKVNTPNTTRL